MLNLDVLLFLLGIPIGVVTSLFGWWILWRVLSPRGQFALVLSSSSDVARAGRVRYRAKFLSTGRRPMMDVLFTAMLFVPDIEADGGQALIQVPVFDEMSPRIGGGRRRRPSARRSVLDAPHRVLTLRLSDIDQAQMARFREDLRTGLSGCVPGALESLLGSYPGASVQIVCTASDGWTGSRRTFDSPVYDGESIRNGFFRRGRTLQFERHGDGSE